MTDRDGSGDTVPCEEGIVPWLEMLRRAWKAGRGVVLLRLRPWEKRGTCGASAARSRLSFGTSGTGGVSALAKRFPGVGRGRPLATRMESRMGLRRRVEVAGAVSCAGIGGRAARS